MHDDDDDDDHDPDINAGRIFYSGINPDADRAGYALPRGEPALQDGDVEFEASSEVRSEVRLSGRTWIACGLGIGATGASLAFLASQFGLAPESDENLGRPVRPRLPEHPAWVKKMIAGLREVGAGPIEDLIHAYPTYVMIVEAYGGSDPELWNGIVRLAEFVRLDRSKRGYEIAQCILASFDTNPPPPHLRHVQLDLEDFVHRWEKTKR